MSQVGGCSSCLRNSRRLHFLRRGGRQMVLGEVRLEQRKRVLRGVCTLKQLDVLRSDRTPLDERLEIENLIPARCRKG